LDPSALILTQKTLKLFFYSNYSREAEDRMEIDFLIAKPSITSKHNISPIEVKSTNRYTISSLEKCVRKYKNFLSTPYVIHTSLYISGKASNRHCGLKLFLFHEVPFGGNKPFTMCKNPLKWGRPSENLIREANN